MLVYSAVKYNGGHLHNSLNYKEIIFNKKSPICIKSLHYVNIASLPQLFDSLTISITVISGVERKRMGGPAVPVPRLT